MARAGLKIVFCALCVPVLVLASQKYASNTGAGAHNGTSWADAWSMSEANAHVTAGDTVMFTAGTYTTAINPAVGGTAGSPIVYRNAGTNYYTSVCSLRTAGSPIVLSAVSYVSVVGFAARSTADASPLKANGSPHCMVSSCRLYGGSSHNTVGAGETPSVSLSNSPYFRFIGNLLDREDSGIQDDNVRGDGVMLTGNRAIYCIIEGNTIRNVSHFGVIHVDVDTLQDQGNGNIIRNNTIYNVHVAIGQGGWQGGELIEGNRCYSTGQTTTYRNGATYEQTTQYSRVRYNMFYEDSLAPFTTYGWGRPMYSNMSLSQGEWGLDRGNRVYHNAILTYPGYSMPRIPWASAYEDDDAYAHGTYARHVIKNNIISTTPQASGYYWGADKNPAYLFYNPSATEGTNALDTLAGNVLWSRQYGDSVISVNGTLYTLAAAKSAYGNNILPSNLNASPGWQDSTSKGGARSFALSASSHCVDAAVPLATVLAGSSGTVVSVSDPYAFHYNNGASPYERGDSVYINGDRREIDSVDYANGNLILTAAATVAPGEGVYVLATWSAQTGTYTNRFVGSAPDIGPAEYSGAGGGEPTPPPAVWAAPDGVRIMRSDTSHWTRYGVAANTVWDGNTVNLFGLRNETVAFQLMLLGGASGKTGMDVRLDTLTLAGEMIRNTSSDYLQYAGRNIEVFVENYLPITGRLTKFEDEPGAIGGVFRGSLPKDTVYVGDVPDALIPIEAPYDTADSYSNGNEGGAPFKILANKLQGIWVDIYIPKTATAGVYTGYIRIKQNGTIIQSIPVELTVKNAQMPDVLHLPNFEFGSWCNTITHGVQFGAWDSLLVHRYKMMFHRHRLNLTFTVHPSRLTLGTGAGYGQYLRGTGYSTSHWLGGYSGPGLNVGDGAYPIGAYDLPDNPALSGFSSDSTAWMAAADWWQGWFEDSAASCLAFRYLNDEPQNDVSIISSGPDAGWRTSYVYGLTRKRWTYNSSGAGKRLKCFWTSHFGIDDPAQGIPDLITGGIDGFMTTGKSGPTWWGYHVRAGDDPAYNEMHVEDLQEGRYDYLTGTTRRRYVSSYNGYRPFFPMVPALDVPQTDARACGSVFRKYGNDMWWMWETEYHARGRDPNYLQNRYTAHPEWGLGTEDVTNPWADPSDLGATLVYSGEERLYNAKYLGPDVSTIDVPVFPDDDRGIHGPVASIRLKMLRRGFQDYEYFWMADSAGISTASALNSLVPAAYDDKTYITQYNPYSADTTLHYPLWDKPNWVYEAWRSYLATALAGGSTVTIPAVPTNIAPVNASTQSQPVTFRWTRPTGATKFWLCIARKADNWSMLYVNKSDITDTAYTVTGMQGETEYVWNVAAGNSAGWSAWSGEWSFTTLPVGTGSQTITVDWNRVTSAETLTDNATVEMEDLQRRDYVLVLRNPNGKQVTWDPVIKWVGLATAPQPTAGDTSLYWLVRDGTKVYGVDLSSVSSGGTGGVTAAWVLQQIAANLGGAGYDGQNADSIQGRRVSGLRHGGNEALLYSPDSLSYLHRALAEFDSLGLASADSGYQVIAPHKGKLYLVTRPTGGGGAGDIEGVSVTAPITGGGTSGTVTIGFDGSAYVTKADSATWLLTWADALAAFAVASHAHAGTYQPADADLDDLADGTLSGSKVQQFGTSNAGAVPASGGGTSNYLRADGTWAAPAGGAGGVADGQDADSLQGKPLSGLRHGGKEAVVYNPDSSGYVHINLASLDTTGFAASDSTNYVLTVRNNTVSLSAEPFRKADKNNPTFTGSLTASSSMRGTGSFSGTAQRTAVYVSGLASSDYCFVCANRDGDPAAGDILNCYAKTDSIIVRRRSSGTSNLSFNWWRVK